MELNICERFPSLSPFDVRKERASEVFKLIGRIRKSNVYRSKEASRKNVIRRPAGDNWF
jgi:hypothetical protein